MNRYGYEIHATVRYADGDREVVHGHQFPTLSEVEESKQAALRLLGQSRTWQHGVVSVGGSVLHLRYIASIQIDVVESVRVQPC